MKKYVYVMTFLILAFVGLNIAVLRAQESPTGPLSSKTQLCLGCHTLYTPGMVADWRTSRHSQTTPTQGMGKAKLEQRISAENVPDDLSQYVVGCYECHGLNSDKHQDSFDHMGTTIHVIVTPDDCKTCHPTEVSQYSDSKKAHAYKNLMNNPVYHTLVNTITGVKTVDESGAVTGQEPSQLTLNDTCLGCHGTKIGVEGEKQIESRMGQVTVPNLTNWPNQGVGRENPDGSIGSCTSCHARHGFSIQEARKPYTCAQCHGRTGCSGLAGL